MESDPRDNRAIEERVALVEVSLREHRAEIVAFHDQNARVATLADQKISEALSELHLLRSVLLGDETRTGMLEEVRKLNELASSGRAVWRAILWLGGVFVAVTALAFYGSQLISFFRR